MLIWAKVEQTEIEKLIVILLYFFKIPSVA